MGVTRNHLRNYLTPGSANMGTVVRCERIAVIATSLGCSYKYEKRVGGQQLFYSNAFSHTMQRLRDVLRGMWLNAPTDDSQGCYDCQYREMRHGAEQRYVSPSTGKCKPLVVQAVQPNDRTPGVKQTLLDNGFLNSTKLAVWLVFNFPSKIQHVPRWFFRWVWFTITLLWPFNQPKYTGRYPAYLSRYYKQLWAARSPREYSLRSARLEPQPVREVTHSTHPRRLVIYDPSSMSWNICTDEETIKQQNYVAISYRYKEVVPNEEDEVELVTAFITEVEATVASLNMSAYWIDLTLTAREKRPPPQEVDKDFYRMADVYRGAEFTLIMLCPLSGVSETDSWLEYGRRLWTLPEALLSHELRYKFRGGEVTPITLHQLANRAFVGFPQESAIINAYGLRDPLERLERLSMLKSALWNRTSSHLERLARPGTPQYFRAVRVYALMGFFEHRIHPHFQESELQALARLSMANDNDRFVERMISLLPPPGQAQDDLPCWYTQTDVLGANLWDVEPVIQVVGMTEGEALVIGGCRATAIRWKNFPTVAFAMQRSVKRTIATFLPYLFWELLLIGISQQAAGHQPALLIIALLLMLFSPIFVAYGSSGRIVQAQPWLIGVKGLVSAEQASMLTYGASISELPRTAYSASGTPFSQTETGIFRRGDPAQLAALRRQPGEQDDDDLYSLVDTVSATIYYFRATRPPTVCLYTGREAGLGRFVLCSERCTANELHRETVVRMPWYISQFMPACDWVALR